MKFSRRRIQQFQGHIFSWWELNKRDLPWRHTHDPYKILVSEVMLQQTQVSRVLAGYHKFIEAYPTIDSLANASTADVLKIWKGMGYNRRALYLHKAAKIIVEQFHNRFPVSEQLLSKLPGVGTYTARALLVFAFGKNIAAVDTNIRQIITHFFFHDKQQKDKVIQNVADQLLPPGKSWEWHQALMDHGALALQSRARPRDLSKKTILFKQSNRYIRGKIMNMVREGKIEEPPRLTRVIDGLVKDGLVERKNGKIQLPGG